MVQLAPQGDRCCDPRWEAVEEVTPEEWITVSKGVDPVRPWMVSVRAGHYERLIDSFMSRDFADRLAEELRRPIREAIAAIAQEREACAKLAEDPKTYDAVGGWGHAAMAVGNVRTHIAAAIRARM
jgi:hypothetical protein